MADEAMGDDEFAQMQARVAAEQARRDAAKAEADAARMAPIHDIVESAEFAPLLAALIALPLDLRTDEPFGPPINAMRVGMEGLLRLVQPASIQPAGE